jgi:hypothetical protein
MSQNETKTLLDKELLCRMYKQIHVNTRKYYISRQI